MEEPRQKKMAVIASKGTLDMAYPPFILATTAAALGWEVQIFFTFYGLQLLRKSLKTMMKQKIKKHGVASLEDLRAMCLEADIKMIACQMTIDLFEFKKSEFIDGIEYGGAAMFLEFAGEADVTLFI